MPQACFDLLCRISVEHTPEHFHAHVEFDGDVPIFPGDRVRVHGDPIALSFGKSAVFERTATVTRAGPIRRVWTRLASYLDFSELYEVSFTPRAMP